MAGTPREAGKMKETHRLGHRRDTAGQGDSPLCSPELAAGPEGGVGFSIWDPVASGSLDHKEGRPSPCLFRLYTPGILAGLAVSPATDGDRANKRGGHTR